MNLNGRHGYERRKYMYHYLENKEFIHKMRAFSGEILQNLCHTLKEKYGIGAIFYLVGSGAKNLITQNNKNPIDLDYNLEIIKCDDINNCCYIKECVRKSFNIVLKKYNLNNCEDSKSSLTSKNIFLKCSNRTPFHIDICITSKANDNLYYRLIHKKTGFTYNDTYYWNIAPNSRKIKEKADYIKKNGCWQDVREQYLYIKNRYLSQNDRYHSSFICYIEVINNVYNSIKPKILGVAGYDILKI